MLGDDIVIADARVAQQYKHFIEDLHVKISEVKTLSSSNGCYEFLCKFITPQGDLSPFSCKAIRAAASSIGIFPLFQ